MTRSIGKAIVPVLFAVAIMLPLAGCKFGGSSASSSSSSSPSPTAAVQGVETPSSISVVSANNAN